MFKRGVLFILLGLIGWGCAAPEAEPYILDEAAFTLFESVNREAMRHAHQALPDYNYSRYLRTEQLDKELFAQAHYAYREQFTTQQGRRERTVAEADSMGDFDFGYFNRSVATISPTTEMEAVVSHLLPETPAYLAEENRDGYDFRTVADTLLDGTLRVTMVEARARPEAGDGLNIRRVRYYIEPETQMLVALSIQRSDLALLFREESGFFYRIALSPDGRWTPHRLEIETQVQVPFAPAVHFRSVMTFSGFALP